MTRIRNLLALVVCVCLAGSAKGQAGWAVSPVVVIPRPQLSVLGALPGCSGRVIVSGDLQSFLGGLGGALGSPGELPDWTLRLIAGALNLIGYDAILQDYAICAEVCAVLPLSATRVTRLIGYVSNVSSRGYAVVPIGHATAYFRWDSEIDTTRFGDDGRLLCVRARNWSGDVRAFLVVGYE